MPSWGPTRWGGACAVKRFGEAKTLKSAEFTSDDLSKITGLPHGAWEPGWDTVGQRGYRAAGAYPGGTGSPWKARLGAKRRMFQNMPAPLKHFQNK